MLSAGVAAAVPSSVPDSSVIAAVMSASPICTSWRNLVRTVSCQTSCDLMRSLSVLMLTPVLRERRGEAVDVEIVLLRHVAEDLVHTRRRPAMTPWRSALLHLQTLLDQHVDRFLLQLRRGLRLLGDGEKAHTLIDVVVGNRIVIDQHLDRHFLRRAAIGAADDEEGEQQSRQQGSQAGHSERRALSLRSNAGRVDMRRP